MSLKSRLKRRVLSIDSQDEGKKWNERRRRGLYEARISRHEIAATGENLRSLIIGRRAGRVLKTRPGRKRERENRCVTSGGQHLRAARVRPLTTFHWNRSLVKRRRSQPRALPHTRSFHMLNNPRIELITPVATSFESTFCSTFQNPFACRLILNCRINDH